MAERKSVSWGEALDESGRRFWETGIGHTLADALDFVKLPGQAAKGEVSVWDPATGHVSDDVINKSAGGTLAMGLGSGAVHAMSPGVSPAGSAGVFVGRKGGERLGKQLELETAENLYKQGFPIEDIRRQTGWGFGPRGEHDWQYEISDREMALKPGTLRDDGAEGLTSRLDPRSQINFDYPTVGKSLHHPEFLEAYPDAAHLSLDAGTNAFRPPGGMFDSEGGRIRAHGMDEQEMREILAHELQHTADGLEGKPGGSSPSWTRKEMDRAAMTGELPRNVARAYGLLPESQKRAIAYRRYRHDAGEVGAETTRNRLDLTPEQRRETPLSDSYPKDVNPDQITLGRASAHYSRSEPGPKPEMAKGPSKEADNLGKALEPIRAYHGSPHDFDKFSLDKIGTGEGAQAYGHGLYFAENEGVAKSYRDTLAAQARAIGPKPQSAYIHAAKGSLEAGFSSEDTLAQLRGAYKNADEETLKAAVREAATDGKGRMYEVQINADPDRFLDWDRPLGEQSRPVQEAVSKARFGDSTIADVAAARDQLKQLEETTRDGMGRYSKMTEAGRQQLQKDLETRNQLREQLNKDAILERSGGAMYGDLMLKRNKDAGQIGLGADQLAQQEVARQLREAGIPGIKYLDQASRGAGEGSRNYVVFSDEIVNIVKKYGIAGLALLPPAVLAQHGIDPASVGASSPQADALER